MPKLPPRIADERELDDWLSDPSPAAIESLGRLEGDLLVLGVSGKMGPSLARMAVRASQAAGVRRRVIGVARFSDSAAEARLHDWGIETIRTDLLDERQLAALPDAPLVVAMTGMKFGSSSAMPLTWAMNTLVAARIAQRFASSRIVAFSTGNIYPLCPVTLGGSRETDNPGPVGEYAMSCLGRERMYEHFSRVQQTPVALARLNYAHELRYGVMVDLAQRIARGETIDLAMGNFNAIWQGDANAQALAALSETTSPAWIFNMAGPETLSVRRVCEQLAARMGTRVQFTGSESPTSLLSNGQAAFARFGYPRVDTEHLIAWIAEWVSRGGASLGKPTHFETRDGQF